MTFDTNKSQIIVQYPGRAVQIRCRPEEVEARIAEVQEQGGRVVTVDGRLYGGAR